MSVWEDAELASPHNQGVCWPLVGNPDAQGDGRNPQVNQQNVGGLRGEEKWRPDRIGTPEAREIRTGRCEGPSGRSGRGAEGVYPAHLGTGSLLSFQAGTPFQSPLLAACVLGSIEGRPGRSGEAGRRDPPGPEQLERRGGCLPCPLKPRKPSGLPGDFPRPLRPGVGGMPGPHLFLESKPHPLQHPGPFPALLFLSIGYTHHPNITFAQSPPSTTKAIPTIFFFFFSFFSFPSSSFVLLWC